METLVCKVKDGTKARLKLMAKESGEKCLPSDLVREALESMLSKKSGGSAHAKAPELCGAVKAPADAATSKDYLNQFR